ncbi:MAG: nucleotidyltransferase domain-containing protein [Chitinivibrionia bacterium]|nr:nucleotidyltransferase domain-containing protein [Chitinivibrionia bacterium]
MMYGLPQRTLDSMEKIFRKYPIKQVILYGSRAKGNFRNNSDIDMTLITDETFTRTHLLRIYSDFDDSDIPYLVDISMYEALNNEDLKEHINRVGKVIFENKFCF